MKQAGPVDNLKTQAGSSCLRLQSKPLECTTLDGIADFHANRVPFITSLCRSNINLIMAKKLARRSAPKLTDNIYSKVPAIERAAAINGILLEG